MATCVLVQAPNDCFPTGPRSGSTFQIQHAWRSFHMLASHSARRLCVLRHSKCTAGGERRWQRSGAQCVGSDDMSTGGAPRRSRAAILVSRFGMVVSGLVGGQVRMTTRPAQVKAEAHGWWGCAGPASRTPEGLVALRLSCAPNIMQAPTRVQEQERRFRRQSTGQQ
jgi:hypothetical protein